MKLVEEKMQVVYLIDNEEKLKKELIRAFNGEKNYRFYQIKKENIEEAEKDIPSLIIINEDTIDNDIIELCRKIKDNDDNAITPTIVISSNTSREHRVRILKESVTYYIKKPIDFEYLYYTIKNITNLLYINRKVSPLTNLPGNVQIQAEMKKRLWKKEYFVMLYLDLDNFKAYNDVYGFVQGDEIIKLTARIITKNIHLKEEDNNFVGHIGGDDFIAILEDHDFEKICQNIIIDFDNSIKKYFSDIDLKRGYFEVPNRKGIIEQFPLTSISIAAVEVPAGRFHNTLEISEAGAQVKHLSKSIPGSTYVIDRRK